MSARSELDAAGILDPALRAGYRLSRQLNAEHGKTYYLAALLLPPEKRPYVHALYGFARYVDDIVDDLDASTDERTAAFEAWSEAFLADLEWGQASNPIVRALIDTVRHWSIPHSYFADFLDSMRADLTVSGYPTEVELDRYVWGSAAVIGLQMLPVLGRRDETVRWDELETPAIELGVAFQLTNFLRDVGEDLRRGRVYLPESTMAQFGVDRDRLARGRVDEPIRNLLAWQIEQARDHYRAAEPGLDLVHPTSRDCIATALTLYEGILDEIEARDYDVFTGRANVGLPRRVLTGLRGARSAIAVRRGRPADPADPATSTDSTWRGRARTRTAGLRPGRGRSARR